MQTGAILEASSPRSSDVPRFVRASFALLLIALFAGCSCIHTLPPVDERQGVSTFAEDTVIALDEALIAVREEDRVPGLAVGVVENGEIAYLRAFGTGSLDTAAPLTIDDPFHTASISKLFTTLLLMQLSAEELAGDHSVGHPAVGAFDSVDDDVEALAQVGEDVIVVEAHSVPGVPRGRPADQDGVRDHLL
jgi:hypothetical protein